MMSPITPETQASIRRHLLAGAIGGALLFVGAGGWAATAEFSGAVVTAGSLVVESDVKKVQHPTGGVVGELRVKNGDRVAAGDVLLRLDETASDGCAPFRHALPGFTPVASWCLGCVRCLGCRGWCLRCLRCRCRC